MEKKLLNPWGQTYGTDEETIWNYFTFLSSQRLVFSAPQYKGFLLNGSYVFNRLPPVNKNRVFLKC